MSTTDKRARRRWLLTGKERWTQGDRETRPMNSGSNQSARIVSFVELREHQLDCGHWVRWEKENARRGWALYCFECSMKPEQIAKTLETAA